MFKLKMLTNCILQNIRPMGKEKFGVVVFRAFFDAFPLRCYRFFRPVHKKNSKETGA